MALYRIVDDKHPRYGDTLPVEDLVNALGINDIAVRWIPGGVYEGDPEFDYNDWLVTGSHWRRVAIRVDIPSKVPISFMARVRFLGPRTWEAKFDHACVLGMTVAQSRFPASLGTNNEVIEAALKAARLHFEKHSSPAKLRAESIGYFDGQYFVALTEEGEEGS